MRMRDWSSDVCSSDHAVEDQVEFNVAAAAISLEVPLPLAVFDMPALFDYRHVGVQKGVAYGLGHGKAGLEASLVDIVEEQTAYAPGFVAVFQVEILVRSEEHTSELQSLMCISDAVFCLKNKKTQTRSERQIHK